MPHTFVLLGEVLASEGIDVSNDIDIIASYGNILVGIYIRGKFMFFNNLIGCGGIYTFTILDSIHPVTIKVHF